MFPASDASIMHEHEAVVAKGMAVLFGQVSFCRGADVGEDEGRGGFCGKTREVHTVPGGNRRREDAWLGT